MMVHTSSICLLVVVIMMGSAGCHLTVDDLAENLKKLESKVNKLDTSLQEMKNKQVAFLAQLSSPDVPASGPCRFDNVIFNDGNGFDPTQGIFIAPFSGVYIFSLQMFTYNKQRIVVDIMRNVNIFVRMALDTRAGLGEESGSSTVTVKLAKGDMVWVWVRTGYDGPIKLIPGVHTVFAGWLQYGTSD